MSPDQDELDDEIRGHMAISIKQRIERGEDPGSARLAEGRMGRQRGQPASQVLPSDSGGKGAAGA